MKANKLADSVNKTAVISTVWCIILLVTSIILFTDLRELQEDYAILEQELHAEIDSSLHYATLYKEETELTSILEDEIKVLTDQAEVVAALDPLDLLTSPAELTDFIDQIPRGNPFNERDWYITARFGADRGHSGNPRMGHRGNDVVVISNNWSINPIGSGKVVDIGIDTWLGKYVIVEHNPNVRSLYAHLSTIFYEAIPGETVTPETTIGIMGNTGYSDGAHLHIEVQIYDGKSWHSIDSYPFLNHLES